MQQENNIWQKVLEKINIVDVISEFVNLKKSGANYVGSCPFHSEKTASFTVSEQKQIFKCFGCQKSGNAIKFLELKENITPFEALNKLAKKTNIDTSFYNQYHSSVSQEAVELYEINKEILNFFQYQYFKNKRLNNSNLLAIISKRKIESSEEDLGIVNHFNIGYAPKDEKIYDYLISKHFLSENISKASIVSSVSQDINFFNDRLMFPIYDKDLNCVGFSGRSLVSDENVKYLNTSENAVFKKNSLFFNWQNVKNNLAIDKEIYLVEGQFDVIALYRIKIINALAIMGTSLTTNHLEMIRGCTINLFFDGDRAGKEATVKNLKVILSSKKRFGLNVNIIKNDTGKDPDELYFSQENGNALKRVINYKISYLDFIYDYCFGNVDANASLEAKKQALFAFESFKQFLSDTDFSLLKEKISVEKKVSTEALEKIEKEQTFNNAINVSNEHYLNFNNNRQFVKRDKENKYNLSFDKIILGKKAYEGMVIKACLKQPYLIQSLKNRLKSKNKFLEYTFTNKFSQSDYSRIIKILTDYVIENNIVDGSLNLRDIILKDLKTDEEEKKNLLNKLDALDAAIMIGTDNISEINTVEQLEEILKLIQKN
ncbi:DNA primase [[Mycoplasma] gypis]|uniref:DNA primase n=1 Tax=[Mycoplasma] gypis TaxID=92404 RepID=A0ABZ2RQH9_9BACT|nr:DNA primase [[Mycoplasma] gypis]MBN0919322.1 DNA primase [[Mycoplasma] gypis]